MRKQNRHASPWASAVARRLGITLAAWALLVAPSSTPAAQFRTQNFVVDAPDDNSAREFGKAAEYYRREKAIEWLGQEMPPWPQPCPLRVTVTMGASSGATSFSFGGSSLSQTMQIEGRYDRLLKSVLPHEVTHTVLAHRFRRPVPRWADEGGAVLSEDDEERHRHDSLCRQMLNAGRAMPLKYLFSLTEYPRDVMVLYAEGFSVTRFLVESSDRQRFLQFVEIGLTQGWDAAARSYGFSNVNALEQAWIDSLRKPRGRDAGELVSRGDPRGPAQGDLTARLRIRDTAPPSMPVLDAPVVFRGQSPSPDRPTSAPNGNRPGYLPPAPTGRATSQPLGRSASGAMPAPVLLGPPQLD